MKKLHKEEHYLEKIKHSSLCEDSLLDKLSSTFSLSKLLNSALNLSVAIFKKIVHVLTFKDNPLEGSSVVLKNYSATDEEMRVYAFKKQIPNNNIPFVYLNKDYPRGSINEEKALSCQCVRDILLMNNFTLEYSRVELEDGTMRICFVNRELNVHLATIYEEFKLGYFAEGISYITTTKVFLNDLPVALEKLFLNRVELREV